MEHDYHSFYRQELINREELGFPPFSRGVLVRFSAKEEDLANSLCEKYFEALDKKKGFEILGPAPMPLYRLRNYFRTFVYIRGKSSKILHEAVSAALSCLPKNIARKVRIQIVFDPDNLL